jgi:hypothetical protein
MMAMYVIWQLIMIGVHGTGRLKYTFYRVFPILSKTNFAIREKSDMHSAYKESKREEIFFFCCTFHEM